MPENSEKFLQPPEMPPENEPTVKDIDQYIADHQHEDVWKDAPHARGWGLINVLPFFETQCNNLRENGSPELYHCRQLTHFLDKETYSGGHAKMTKPTEITLLLAPDIGERYSAVSFNDSLEKLEAGVARDNELEILKEYEAHPATIEPILGLIEDRVAWLDHEIEREYRMKNANAREESIKRDKIKSLEVKRTGFRRARIFLLDQYFPK